MTTENQQPDQITPEDSTHVIIVDQRHCGSTRTTDSGHERLIQKQPSTDGRSIPHCRASKPPNYLGFAIIVIPFNCFFGSIAVVFSLLSLQSTKSGDFSSAKTRGNVSKWLSIIGIAVSLVILAFVVVYFVYIDKNIVDTALEFAELMDNQPIHVNGSAVVNGQDLPLY